LQENLSVPTVYRNTNTAMALFPRERHPFAEKIFLKLLLPSPKTRTATVNRFRRMVCCCVLVSSLSARVMTYLLRMAEEASSVRLFSLSSFR
jgi:hypothetical protein